MTKPILVVTTRYPKEVEDRIDRDYNARRNPDQSPFSQEKLLSASRWSGRPVYHAGGPIGLWVFPESLAHAKNRRHILGGF